MIYNISIQYMKENTVFYQSLKIEVETIEELFDKLKIISFLINGFVDSITIIQEVKKEYVKHEVKSEERSKK